ncbi:DUF6377 domain-containing protein [Mucilaginibacter koreensis]
MNVLKSELARADRYDSHKAFRLQKMKMVLARTPIADYTVRYAACNQIYDEYRSFKFDSAYVYTQEMMAISKAAKDVPKQNESRIKLAFILISAGMFKETFECLNEVNTSVLSKEDKQEYYSIKSRAYGDLADYNSGNDYAKADNLISTKYLDSAIAFSKPNSFERLINLGGKQVQNQQMQQPSVYYADLLDHYPLTAHQRAMVATGLSRFYYRPQDKDKQIALLTIAAINDIRSSTKETLAIFKLGEELYRQGDIMDAYTFVQEAMNNAQFYGARLRTIKIGAVLPVIAAQRLIVTENEKKRFLIYLVSITALAIVISLISFIVFNQLKRLRIKERIIEDKNLQLEQINDRLIEDTRIKEEYIGNFFNIISEYISKLEKLKRSIERKLTTKKYDEILSTINEINIKKEREQLFHTFDHTFLKIFPNFVTVFNSLLKEEDQIWPKDNEVLNTDLRIFALIRLGIDNNQAIANILEYSVNTIYVYKMRIKAKSIVSSEQFDRTIMDVKAVDVV